MSYKTAEQKKSKWIVQAAIRSGRLIRPDICEKCGKNPGRAKDGRALIQGHHHDYSKPLDIEWLCTRCHGEELRPNPAVGEASTSAKLTEEQVREIRQHTGGCVRLSRKFGVAPSSITHVQRRITWKHLP